MAYEFKKLSDVAVVDTPADTANVLIEEDGVIKKVSKDNVVPTVEALPLPETATVGQTFKVSEIDENGKVTKIEAVDMPSEFIAVFQRDIGSASYSLVSGGDYESCKQALLNSVPVKIIVWTHDTDYASYESFTEVYLQNDNGDIYVGIDGNRSWLWQANNQTNLSYIG